MDDYLQAIVTVLSLVNPVICGAIFAKVAAGQAFPTQLIQASKAAITVLVILLLTALFGAQILNQFGVSLDAFRVAGGGVLAWMGIGMLSGKSSTTSPSGDGSEPSIIPLVMFAASPGTITGVITLSIHHADLKLPVAAIVAVCVAVSVMWLVVLAAARFGGGGQGGLMHDMATRFMGLIVIAMGVQFALSGLKLFMANGG